jgi:hypothetical protein
MKAQFLALPFRKETTLAEAQCMEWDSENKTNWNIKL